MKTGKGLSSTVHRGNLSDVLNPALERKVFSQNSQISSTATEITVRLHP